MAVIAMTREMGSLGKDVALGLADTLGLDLIQHEIIEHVADRMHLGESAVNRFLEGRAGLLERWGVDERGLSLYTTEEVINLAAKGDVLIRGWGATYVLGPVSHVVCV
ncbi:MAG: cytidylate kinase-like family protein, partial [Gammaproteobacteria bacterium]|nr:cytidylate kinase-like family protein [Gammaproteobacteria bacterium]